MGVLRHSQQKLELSDTANCVRPGATQSAPGSENRERRDPEVTGAASLNILESGNRARMAKMAPGRRRRRWQSGLLIDGRFATQSAKTRIQRHSQLNFRPGATQSAPGSENRERGNQRYHGLGSLIENRGGQTSPCQTSKHRPAKHWDFRSLSPISNR